MQVTAEAAVVLTVKAAKLEARVDKRRVKLKAVKTGALVKVKVNNQKKVNPHLKFRKSHLRNS